MAQDYNMLLDSVVTYKYSEDRDSSRYYKYDYLYNDEGRLTRETFWFWDSENSRWTGGGGTWEEFYSYSRREFEYDSHGNQIKTLIYYWEEESQQFIAYRKIDKEFDKSGNITMLAHKQWDTIQKSWIGLNSYWAGLLGRTEYTYDSLNRPTSELLLLWNHDINDWKSHEKDLYWYGKTGENKYHENYLWDYGSDNWISIKKEKFIYDLSNNLVYNYLWYFRRWNGTLLERKTNMNYDSEDRLIWYRHDSLNHKRLVWIPERYGEYEYLNSGLTTLVWTYRFDIKENKWISFKDYKLEYEYDDQGNIIMESRYSFRYDSIYTPDYKNEYSYDQSGRLLIKAKYKGFQDHWVGEQQGKEENTYDQDGNLILWTVFSWDGESQSWKPIYFKEKDYNQSGFLISDKYYLQFTSKPTLELFTNSIYYYNGLVTEIDEVVQEPFLIYPNPTSGFINILGLTQPVEARIFSLQGQLLKSIQQVQNTINISDLHPGMYIINLYVWDQILVRKIVKE